MPDLDNGGAPAPGTNEPVQPPHGADPAYDPGYDPILEMQIAARERHPAAAPGMRPKRQFRTKEVLLTLGVVLALVAGAVLIGFGESQLRKGEGSKPPKQATKPAETNPVATEPTTSSATATSSAMATATAAAISEATTASAQIASLSAMRTELASVMSSLTQKAQASAAASAAWSKLWASRRAAYSSRLASVRAHNARERSRYYASRTEVANSSGQLVIRYTYRPRYLSSPSAPKKPAPLKVSVADEKARLAALAPQVAAFSSAMTSQTPVGSFASVYSALSVAAQALGTTTVDAQKTVSVVVIKQGDKGQVIDAKKLSAVNLAALDAPFAAVDQAYAAALSKAGLTAEQVSAAGTSAP